MKKLHLIGTMTFALILVIHLPAFAASSQLNMRLTTDTPDVMPQGVAATWFGQEIQKRLPGSQAKIFNASSLMNNMDSLEAMHSGTLEASWATMSKISGILPQVLAVRTPTLFTTYDQIEAIPKTEFGKYIEKAALARNFLCLGWGIVSPYGGIAAKQRILTLADWKGKKVRVYDRVTQVSEVTLAGGSPSF
jgi:TRAP-type C4-dicarboxylate transport system substrate-binding protein